MKIKSIYVVSATNGYAKVGYASLPSERFTGMQCNSPLILTLEYQCACPDAAWVEATVHQALARWHRHREWFEVQPSVAIAAVRAAMATRQWLVRSAAIEHKAMGVPKRIIPAINEAAWAAA